MNCIEANQRLEPLRKQFSVRYYRWAEQELLREIDSGFARVRKVKSSRVFHYLDFLLELNPQERAAAAFAFLRKAHKDAFTELGGSLTPEEQGYIEKFQRRFYPIASLSRSETQLLENIPESEFELDAEEFEHLLESETSRVLQESLIKGRPYSFQQRIGCWFLQTSIDVHSIFQLRYEHTIDARNANDLCPVHLKERGISLLGWLGVHPGTDFDRLRRSEMNETASFMAETIQHFVLAAPALLAGLEHDIPAELDMSVPRRRSVKKHNRQNRK